MVKYWSSLICTNLHVSTRVQYVISIYITIKYNESVGCIGTSANTTDQISDISRIRSTTYLSCTHAYAKGTQYGKILE